MPGRARRRPLASGARQIHHHLEPRGRHAIIHARGAHERRLAMPCSPMAGWPGATRSIILWNPADGAQLATLEGPRARSNADHARQPARVGSDGPDRYLGPCGRQAAHKHEGHTAMVRCLATLDGGACIGRQDESIRIRRRFTRPRTSSIAASAAREVGGGRSLVSQAAASATCRRSAVQQFDEHIGGLFIRSAARQAHVFDAPPKRPTKTRIRRNDRQPRAERLRSSATTPCPYF